MDQCVNQVSTDAWPQESITVRRVEHILPHLNPFPRFSSSISAANAEYCVDSLRTCSYIIVSLQCHFWSSSFFVIELRVAPASLFSKVHNPNIPVFRQADMSLDYKAWSAWIACVLCSDRVLHDYLSMKDPPCVTLQMLMRHLPSAAFNSYCLMLFIKSLILHADLLF